MDLRLCKQAAKWREKRCHRREKLPFVTPPSAPRFLPIPTKKLFQGMRHSSIPYSTVFPLIFLCCQVEGRGQRIDIFSQNGGSDMAQMRTSPHSKNVMFNVLPRNSPLKWSKIIDSSGNYVIPYLISGSYDPSERTIISDAMGRIEANTCIRFNKRTFEKDYIDLQNEQNEGCYTNVGRMSGKNVVMLEANEMATCVEVDIVVHELMHAIGLWHEHMRYDRDDFIKVHYENIDPIYMNQFEKVSTKEATTYGIPYDYKSVMHYTESAFARKGRISMETKDPAFQKVIGNQRDASSNDYKKICILYGCGICMGESFDSENPNSAPAIPTPSPQPEPNKLEEVFPPVTYPSVTSVTEKKRDCNEIFSIFCKGMARTGRLDCRYSAEFCECTCQQFSNVAVSVSSSTITTTSTTPTTTSAGVPEKQGFFQRIWSFLKNHI